MLENFQLHLTERTLRELFRDPELPDNPTFKDMRTALARLDAKEAANQAAVEKRA